MLLGTAGKANTNTHIERADANGKCGKCGASALKRYPVLSEGGWFMVTKCQECLTSSERKPWNKLGYVTREEATL